MTGRQLIGWNELYCACERCHLCGAGFANASTNSHFHKKTDSQNKITITTSKQRGIFSQFSVCVQYNIKMTDVRAKPRRCDHSQPSGVCAYICMHSTTTECRSQMKAVVVVVGVGIGSGSEGKRKPFIMSLCWSFSDRTRIGCTGRF